MDNHKVNECILVSVDFTRGVYSGVLVVGRQRPNGSMEIINAFQGEEAWWIYHNLITKKEKKENA